MEENGRKNREKGKKGKNVDLFIKTLGGLDSNFITNFI